MKVCLITKYFHPILGGIENHCYNLAKKLTERGIDVEVHTSQDTPTKKRVLPKFEILEGVKVIRHKSFSFFIPSGKYDVIHLHNFDILPHFLIFLNILIRRLLGLKTLKIILTLHGGFTPWWNNFMPLKRILKKAYHLSIGKLFLKYVVDKIIALNDWEKEQLVKHGIPAKKIIVIPNGIDDMAYELPPKKSSKFNVYRPYILFLGRISKEKNLDFIIECLRDCDSINFLIAGPVNDIKYFNKIIALIKKYGLDKRVIFVGEVYGAEKYELIDNSVAVVLFSFYETDPLVIKEAMARGKPVIVSNNEPFTYIIKKNENGFLVRNCSEFIRFVNFLLTNPSVSEGISHINKRTSIQYMWNHIISKIIEVYRHS